MLQIPDPGRGARLRPDPVTALTVILFTLTAIGLSFGGFLAVYDWRTPGAITPLVWSLVVVFLGALSLLVLGAVTRWVRGGDPR